MMMLLVAMFILTAVAESPASSPKVSSLTPAAAPSPSSVSPLPPARAPAPQKNGAASHGFSFGGIFVVVLLATTLIL